MGERLLEVRNLQVRFPVYGGILRHKVAEVRAVDNVSVSLDSGETLGLVGESGCGKTTVAKAITNILKSTAPGVHESGQIIYHGDGEPVDLLGLGNRQMRPYRKQIQMIFQDPFSSLNPRHTVGRIIDGPLRIHTAQTARERELRIHWLLERVGLQPEHAGRYPHEFSGGQRQRVGIARALAVNPRLIVADEPVSALDVSVQAQVINLMQDLQDEFHLTYLFVAHDLSVVPQASDRIAVMYLGNLVELGDADAVYRQPQHPYAKALLSAVPKPDPRGDRTGRIKLSGEVPTPLAKPSGCPFRTRCPIAQPSCAEALPPLEATESGQQAACPYTDPVKSGVLLLNPGNADSEVSYHFADERWTLAPGESHKLPVAEQYQVGLERIGGAPVPVELRPGTYVFAAGARGCELDRREYGFTIVNHGQSDPFKYCVDRAEQEVAGEGEAQHQDTYPLLVGHARGDDQRDALHKIRDNGVKLRVQRSKDGSSYKLEGDAPAGAAAAAGQSADAPSASG